MACLCISFDEWLDSEPDALEDDRPTEEQVQEYEEAVNRHTDLVSGAHYYVSTVSNVAHLFPLV
jgi:hypothetical protein